MNQRNLLRKTFRGKRQQILPTNSQTAAHSLVTQAKRLPYLADCQQIAYYFANDHEIDPQPLVRELSGSHRTWFLPVLDPHHRQALLFVRYQDGEQLQPNRFGILEPIATPKNSKQAAELDLIFLPLVAFDNHGHRLGMGGGYYDYTLAFKQTTNVTKPYLVGLAFECQKAEHIEPAHWDITLDAVITEQQLYLFRK